MQLKDENRKLRDILAHKNLEIKMDDQFTEAVKKCSITDQIEDKKMEELPKTHNLDMIKKTYDKKEGNHIRSSSYHLVKATLLNYNDLMVPILKSNEIIRMK